VDYRFARWYDTHPKLAFAINLLQYAPLGLQQRTFKAIAEYLHMQWSLDNVPEEVHIQGGQRWYDFSTEATAVVDLIKASPTQVKNATAVRIIDILSKAA